MIRKAFAVWKGSIRNEPLFYCLLCGVGAWLHIRLTTVVKGNSGQALIQAFAPAERVTGRLVVFHM